MPLLKRLGFISLITFWAALVFGLFAASAGESSIGAACFAIAGAAGVWSVLCAVGDRIVTLLENMDTSLKIISEAAYEAQSEAKKARAARIS